MSNSTFTKGEFVRGFLPIWAAMFTHLSLLVVGIFAGKVVAAQIGVPPASYTGDMIEILLGVSLWAAGTVLVMEILKKTKGCQE